MIDLAFHPLANIFPLLEGEQFAALVADIAASGLCEAVWLYQGHILDGRNRYRACQALGQDCATRDYPGNDPLGFVLSMNVRRRHLDTSQRSMIADKLATLPLGANQHTLGAQICAPTQEQAADLLNVSRRAVQTARKVREESSPEVIQAVESGAMTLTAALPLTAIAKEAQTRLLQEVRHAVGEKRPTATQTRAAVSRGQVVGTVKEQMAAGKAPEAAVTHALHKHAMLVPTPALADAIWTATDRQVTLAATDGVRHDERTKAEETAVRAEPRPMCQLLHALEAIAALPDPVPLLAAIPDASAYRVAQSLDAAIRTLNRFATLWKAHRDAEACHLQGQQAQPSLVPEVFAEPPQPRQPAQAPGRGETGPAQPSEETADATQQTAQTGADYDTTRFYLGKPCRHSHTYGNTGQMLRRKRKGDCVQCHQEWKRARPQAQYQPERINRRRLSRKP